MIKHFLLLSIFITTSYITAEESVREDAKGSFAEEFVKEYTQNLERNA